jgi:hypothetical protein
MWKAIKLFLQWTLIIGAVGMTIHAFATYCYDLKQEELDKRHEREMHTLSHVQAHELRLEEMRWTRRSAELGANQWIYQMLAERVVESLKALLDGNSPLERLGR